ncbi:hypothetical protein U1701_10750 [Sphingomonas sp. PB2P19]|uniref:hypothetical protein n=1 Tax=Sphingomonas rhamnosi TaxID=3096156 RepID=UPI002FCC3B09
MRRALTPLWLAMPSRAAGLSQRAARLGLVVLTVLLLALLTAVRQSAGQTDTGFYAGIVDGVRHGGNYYAVTADTLRGADYPLRPMLAFAMPTLAVVEGSLPPILVRILLYALVLAVAAAWHARLKAALVGPVARGIATALLVLTLLPLLRPSLIAVPETWAGLFVALSLAVRRHGAWLDAVAFGLAAALLRETAVLYLLLMAVFALGEGARREAIGWAAAILVFVVAFGAHAHAVAEVVRSLDSAADPITAGGIGLFIRTAAGATILTLVPLWLAAPMVGLALFGWAMWRDATGLRVLALFVLMAAVIGVFGREDTPHWALMIAPLLLPGLVFAIDGARDLISAARDGRRITVTRIVR